METKVVPKIKVITTLVKSKKSLYHYANKIEQIADHIPNAGE